MINSLLQLPNEILDQIFAHLDTVPASDRCFDELPAFEPYLHCDGILKRISMVSHRLRAVVLGRLFTHLRVDLNSLQQLLDFVHRCNLAPISRSIVIQVRHRLCASQRSIWWRQILEQLAVNRIVLQCAPEHLGRIFDAEVYLGDSWVFSIPCQYIELRRHQHALYESSAYIAGSGLLAATPWQSIRINEGSALPAYTSYEYFLKNHPSLLASLEDNWSFHEPLDHGSALNDSQRVLTATCRIFENLETFSYTAVFPFYNHVDNVLTCVKRMRCLQTFFIKLCPEPSSTILEDAIRNTKGHIDLNDPWSEINVAYTIVAHALFNWTSEGRPLRCFVSGDIGVAGIRDNLVDNVSEKLSENWDFNGHDTWTKRAIEKVGDAVQSSR